MAIGRCLCANLVLSSAFVATAGVARPEGPAALAAVASERGASLKGKSIYFLMVDRFARSDGNLTACSGDRWCNGTLRGVADQLDYIQDMGFDCVWLTPVVKQYEGHHGEDGSAYHGYWAEDFFEIDSHFGTSDDLKNLSLALHSRGMCLMMDMVVNHVRPIQSVEDVQKVSPFNDPAYYNTLGRLANESYDDYFQHPLEAFSQTGRNPPPGRPFCGVGDLACEGYNAEGIKRGWFVDLGDLNQTNEFVSQELLRWVKHMVTTYDLDAIRLDTAAFVEKDFLADFQEAAGVPILAEITATNMSFHASYQADVLDGLLNFPLSELAPAGFCGADFPGATWNLTKLGAVMRAQLTQDMYRDLDLLGNFVDNHDWVSRIATACNSDAARVANALAWVMMSRGIPIIYYGTEHMALGGPHSNRRSLWQTGYNTSAPLYRLLAGLNRVRREHSLGNATAEVRLAEEDRLVFSRGDGAWIFLNSLNATRAAVRYCGVGLPEAPTGQVWADALTDVDARLDEHGCYVAEDSHPKVLLLRETTTDPDGLPTDLSHATGPYSTVTCWMWCALLMVLAPLEGVR